MDGSINGWLLANCQGEPDEMPEVFLQWINIVSRRGESNTQESVGRFMLRKPEPWVFWASYPSAESNLPTELTWMAGLGGGGYLIKFCTG